VLPPELRAARFIPNVSWTPLLVRLIRRLPMPPTRVPTGLTVTNRTIPGPDGAPDVRVRLYRPTGLPPAAPALLWLHGGGHLIGKPEQDDRTNLEFARRGVAVVSVDYRLSPEHPFPAALDDAHAALTWLARPDGELAVDADRIAVGGSSAGGGMAAALAQRVHDEGRIRLALQLLVYPMLDDRTGLRDDAAPADLRVWTPASNRLGWNSYLGTAPGSAVVPEYAVPARRTDLTGLPPAWIGVGTADLFHDEGVAYARRLEAAGVPVTLDVVEGAFHGFDAVFRSAPVTRRFVDSQIGALRGRLAP
jgi:acetyl esterase/lipase